MLDTKIIYHKNKGFWIDIPFIELLMHYFLEVMHNEDIKKEHDWLEFMYEVLEIDLKGYDRGNLGWNLKGRLNYIPERETIFLELLNKTKKLIASKGKEISLEEANVFFASMDIEDNQKTCLKIPVQTKSLIGTIEIIEKMIKDEWHSENHVVNFKGFENFPDEETI